MALGTLSFAGFFDHPTLGWLAASGASTAHRGLRALDPVLQTTPTLVFAVAFRSEPRALWSRRGGPSGAEIEVHRPRPQSKTYTETIRTLVGLARFVIVDLSGSSVPQEITATVDLHGIPFVPILEKGRKEWSMFRDFLLKELVLEPVAFTSHDNLLELMPQSVIAPAEKKIRERQKRLDQLFGRA